MRLANRGRLLLRTPGPVPFVLMLRPFFSELIMSTDLLSFEHPSVLLFCLCQQLCICEIILSHLLTLDQQCVILSTIKQSSEKNTFDLNIFPMSWSMKHSGYLSSHSVPSQNPVTRCPPGWSPYYPWWPTSSGAVLWYKRCHWGYHQCWNTL